MTNQPKLFSLVILAGGLGTRLYPLTKTLPKALVEINDKPFIHHQLQLLHKNNINHIVICAGHLGEKIQDFLDNKNEFGIHIDYSFDGDTLLGTAGAIKKALPLLTDNFFVMYGDSYLPCDYLAVQNAFIQQKKLSLMTVFKNLGQWDTSNVEFFHNQITRYDKKDKTESMHYIDYGLGIFNKTAFDSIENNQPYDLATLYQDLLKKNQLASFEIKERFYEIGSFAGIEELRYHLLQNTNS